MGKRRANRPTVERDQLYDPQQAWAYITLDTPAWFAWLASPTAVSFSYTLVDRAHGYITGYLTVRKERRQRGGSYWVAFRRGAGRVRKVYLGRPAAVTRQRLETVAAALLDGHPGDGTKRDDY
jgi:LuxR family maltose regulon positive regulatory protein